MPELHTTTVNLYTTSSQCNSMFIALESI